MPAKMPTKVFEKKRGIKGFSEFSGSSHRAASGCGIALDTWHNPRQAAIVPMLNSNPPSEVTPAPEVSIGSPPSASDEADWRRYLFLREEMRHEDNLINQRVSWLIGSQAFLLGGFATLISAGSTVPASALSKIMDSMVIGLPVAGILGVVTNYVTILAAVLHIEGMKRFMADRTPPGMPPLRNWHNIHRRMGLFGPLTTPLIFLGFWAVILLKLR